MDTTHRRLRRVPGGVLEGREGREGRSIGSNRRGPYAVVEVAYSGYGGLADGGRDWGYGLAPRWQQWQWQWKRWQTMKRTSVEVSVSVMSDEEEEDGYALQHLILGPEGWLLGRNMRREGVFRPFRFSVGGE